MPSKDNPGKEIADLIFKHFKPTSAQEVQDAIKTVFAAGCSRLKSLS